MTDRTRHLHLAHVYLTECSRRRDDVNRNFYWRLFAWAQAARRRAAACRPQMELFA